MDIAKSKNLLPEIQRKHLLTNLKIGKGLEIYQSWFQDLKIKNCNEDEIIQALRYVFVLIGLRNLPEDIEKAVLLKHIRDHYGNFTAKDIRIAFELALEGKINVDLDHFDRFSVKYFVRVMKPYRQYKAKVIEKAKILLNPGKALIIDIEESAEQYFCIIVLGFYKEYFESENCTGLEGREIESVYDSLISKNFIDLSKKREVYNKNLELAKAGLSEKELKNAYAIVNNGGKKYNFWEKIIVASKKDLILDTFKRWRDEWKKKDLL